MNRSELIDRALGLGLFVLVLAGCFIILRPFLSAIIWAAVLTFSTWPVYLRLKSFLGGRGTLAAAIMTLAIAILVVAPFVIVATGLADNSVILADAARRALDEGLPEPPEWIARLPLVGSSAEEYWRRFAHDGGALVQEAKRFLPALRRISLIVGEALGLGLIQLGMSVFLAFFLYRNGEAVAAHLRGVGSRLAGERAHRLFDVAGGTVISAEVGEQLGTSVSDSTVSRILHANGYSYKVVSKVPRARYSWVNAVHRARYVLWCCCVVCTKFLYMLHNFRFTTMQATLPLSRMVLPR